MIGVGFVFAGRAVRSTMSGIPTQGHEFEAAGATLGGGAMAILTGGFSVAMSIACLMGFAVSYLIGREMKAESAAPTRKCPECAEMIQSEARRCRYCGTSLVDEPPISGHGAFTRVDCDCCPRLSD